MSGDVPAKVELIGVQRPPYLLPLTPKYDETSHKVYVDAIEGALDGPNADGIRNIALTGGYGVGKSSVLQKVAENHDHKVVRVSLSTLGFDRGAKTKSVEPKENPDQSNNPDETKTNLIQKEIVKQLLYREEPVKMPGSRFRRIGRFKKMRALGIAALVGMLIAIVFYLAGWTAKLATLTAPIDPGPWSHLILWAIFTGATFAALALLHNRLQIRQLRVADTDIALTDDTSSYFDQYLDEIVYFFDITKRDIVIFEDIDRFDDAHIFETLRALNTLLNGAGQLKSRRIRFIYAIKDSIFVKLGQLVAKQSGDAPSDSLSSDVVAEVERTNRTKFFDLIVPVVPFITHRNARSLMDDTLKGINGNISAELIDLAARHLTDMRLIKNVRNEFVIFKDKVFQADDGGELALSDDGLFAMMLYKSTHLADFEKIKTGNSNLDLLYHAHGAIVSQAVDALNQEARDKRNQLSHLTTVETRSRELGDDLVAYAERIGRHIGVDAATPSVAFAGQPRTDDELHKPDFWRAFADSNSQLEISFVARGVQPRQFSISKDDAIAEFGDDLASSQQWDAANRAPLQQRLSEIAQEWTDLSYSDMDFLYEHDEYEYVVIDANGNETEKWSFRKHATDILKSELATQLVAGGYIGQDFTLYTSSYYSSRVSTRARNFLLHNVNRSVMQVNYMLDPADVIAIIQERSDTVLREHGMYNVSVLDYLLAPQVADEAQADFDERDRLATISVRSLMANGDDEREFFDAYFTSGGQQGGLIRKLAERWTRVLELVVSRSDLEDDDQIALFNAALESMADGVEYIVSNDQIRLFVEKHFAEFAVLTSDATTPESADRIAKSFGRSSIQFSSLQPLGSEVRRAITTINGYDITRENLSLALGSDDLALDQIRSANDTVYRYVLTDLSGYLAALREEGVSPVTIATGDALAPIVADVADTDLDRLAEVLDGAVDGATVEALASVPSVAWSALADHRAFPLDLGNVTAYIATIGDIDDHLAHQLSEAKRIEVAEDADQTALVALGGQLLNAKNSIPDPATRVALVVSLDLEDWLPLTSVPAEEGNLVGLLICQKVIEDDAGSFALALAQDWVTREFAISKSKNFSTYVTPTELPTVNVAPLMASTLVADSVKDVVLGRADEFVPSDDRAPLAALAAYAARKSTIVPIPLITRMASAGVSATLVVQVLKPVLPQLNETQLSAILISLDGDYATAATRNGKHPKLPNTNADLALAQRLEALSVARSHSVLGEKIKVNMRKS